MTALPPSTDFTGSSVTQGQFKTAISALRTFVADLLGTDSGDEPAARAALGAAAAGANSDITSLAALASINGGAIGPRNPVINGGFRVQQRANATLSGTAQYVLDRWQTFVGGGATGISGTVGQASGVATETNYALGVTGASWTSGYLLSRTRLEGKDTAEYSGKTITISGVIFHDFGSNASFSLSLTKANALDYFSAQTQIGSIPTVLCASGAYTEFSATYTMGATDGDAGLEFAVYSPTVTVANKNVYIGDVMLSVGQIALPFTQPSIGVDLALCQRTCRPLPANSALGQAVSTVAGYLMSQGVPMRSVPTLSQSTGFSIASASAASLAVTSFPAIVGGTTDGAVLIQFAVASGLVAGSATFIVTASVPTFLLSEL